MGSSETDIYPPFHFTRKGRKERSVLELKVFGEHNETILNIRQSHVLKIFIHHCGNIFLGQTAETLTVCVWGETHWIFRLSFSIFQKPKYRIHVYSFHFQYFHWIIIWQNRKLSFQKWSIGQRAREEILTVILLTTIMVFSLFFVLHTRSEVSVRHCQAQAQQVFLPKAQ